MQRYFALNSNLELSNNDIHHIKNVMRMKKNEKIEIIFENFLNECIIESITKSKLEFEIIKKTKIEEKSNKITIAFPLIKEKYLSFFLQKATELSVDEIILINTSRTIVKTDKVERYVKICKEASEQTHRNNIPSINIMDINNIVKYKKDLNIFCSVNQMSIDIKRVLKDNKYDNILVVIGPEGGFTNIEEDFLLENKFISVSLGSNILKSETAGIFILSILNYEVIL